MTMLKDYLNIHPCIAIVRGLELSQTYNFAETLYESGIRVFKVPLNRPNAIECIEKLIEYLPNNCFIGAGTVVTTVQVTKVSEIAGSFIISPNTSQAVIKQAIRLGGYRYLVLHQSLKLMKLTKQVQGI